jgi:UDPglucose--hexose-1-phosphate uridylyltransferase
VTPAEAGSGMSHPVAGGPVEGSRGAGTQAGRLTVLREAFLALPPDTPQETIQARLEEIHAAAGLEQVMDCLYRWELMAGYITRERLEDIERLSFPDPSSGIAFRIQVNHARTRYSDAQERERQAPASGGPAGPAGPTPVSGSAPAPRPCLLCRENVGKPGKETLRLYEFLLDGRERRFFLQLTPFPLYPYHFVPVLVEHSPQHLSPQSLTDMFDFLRLAPNYTVVSNSDVEWAGASILSHLHYQALRGLRLPVMEAPAQPGVGRQLPGALVQLLDYPMAAFRVAGPAEEPVRRAAAALLSAWKGREPGRNTVNLTLIREPGGVQATVLLRNPDYRTPEALRRFKSEGVGVIEASGEAILPVPRGPEAEAMWARIRGDGLSLVKELIAGNSPPREPRGMRSLLQEALGRI